MSLGRADDLAIFQLAGVPEITLNNVARGCGQGNLRAVQLLLGHTKLESTVRYLGIEVDDALSISKQVEL